MSSPDRFCSEGSSGPVDIWPVLRLDNQSGNLLEADLTCNQTLLRIELSHSVAALPGAVAVAVAGLFDRPSLLDPCRRNAVLSGAQPDETRGKRHET